VYFADDNYDLHNNNELYSKRVNETSGSEVQNLMVIVEMKDFIKVFGY
jgi:hypothetical protein